MKGSCLFAGFLLILGVTSAPALAEDAPWSGEVELGYVATSGNTETQTLNFKAGLGYKKGKWTHGLSVSALSTKDEDRVSAEKYTAAAKTDWLISTKSYLWGTVDYEKDRFSGYSYRLSEALGYGYHLIDADTYKLDFEAGPGARQSELDDGTTEHEFVGRARGYFKWILGESASLSETVTATIGDKSTVVTSVTALTASLTNSLAMKASFTAKHTTEVPVGTEETDTETALTLVYKF